MVQVLYMIDHGWPFPVTKPCSSLSERIVEF